MIRDTRLREVVSPNFLGSISSEHLGLAHFDFLNTSLHLIIIEHPSSQHLHCLLLILVLRSAVLISSYDSSRYMSKANGTVRLINMLSPCSAGSEGVNSDIRILYNVFLRSYHWHYYYTGSA